MRRFMQRERLCKFESTNDNILDVKSQEKQNEINKIEAPCHSVKEYNEKIEAVLQKKEYHHWNSKTEQVLNRSKIYDYHNKKLSVDKASLQTQRSILTKYRDCFDEKNIARMSSESGSNKTEIYNEPYFITEIAPDAGLYKVVGVRDFPDGKICIRDCNDIMRLKHTATHETMHDLSYQDSDHKVCAQDAGQSNILISQTDLTSGIHKVQNIEKIIDGKSESIDYKHYNRYLNEGFTELYTIEQMQERGEYPDFDSYSQEVGWAVNLREILGDELIAKAYFGGDIDGLKQRVDEMSSIPGAWETLNFNIDAYNRTGDLRCKFTADDIIDSLRDEKGGSNNENGI